MHKFPATLLQRELLSESILRDSSKSRSNCSSTSFFSAQIRSKLAFSDAKVSHVLRRLLVQFVDLVISFSVCLVRLLPRLLFFSANMSQIHHRSSEVTLRYLCCILDFFPTPLSALSTLSLVLDAASAAKELVATARPNLSSTPFRGRHRPPAGLVPGRRLAPISFRWTSGISKGAYVRSILRKNGAATRLMHDSP